MKRDRKERSQRRLLGRGRDGIWARRSTEVFVFEMGFGERVGVLQADKDILDSNSRIC